MLVVCCWSRIGEFYFDNADPAVTNRWIVFYFDFAFVVAFATVVVVVVFDAISAPVSISVAI